MRNEFLFEISWEVCNKVGGINTVLRTKLDETQKHFGDNYILIGPSLPVTNEFIEETTPFLESIRATLSDQRIPARVGYWNTEEKPAVILVDFQKQYQTDELLYNMWNDFGIDSLASNYDYIEPILFATAAAEIIGKLTENRQIKGRQILAHFHEWLCGAGVLYIRKHLDQVATIFTTHATVLGRALSGAKRYAYHLPKNFDPDAEAKNYGVFAKHSLEKAAAKEADCFTTVSYITADESNVVLQKYPDEIVHNGLNIKKLHQEKQKHKTKTIRTKLLGIAREVTGESISKNALLFVTSGRFEFHNKGYDILLSALAKLETQLDKEDPPIVVFFLIAAKQYSKKNGNSELLKSPNHSFSNDQSQVGIATHPIADPGQDLIIRKCNELGLRKQGGKIRIIYSNAYLNNDDGVFDLPYEKILAGCDLSIFPSFYEPWGYTPLESIAYGTPTITTNLSGFGDWVLHLDKNYQNAVYVLDAKCINPEKISDEICNQLKPIIKQDKSIRKHISHKAFLIAQLADWECFYNNYLDAYDQAVEFNTLYYGKADVLKLQEKPVTLIQVKENILPRFRMLQNECELPENIKELRSLAFNFWWTWHEEAKNLFKELAPDLWLRTKGNPVVFLDLVPSSTLNKFAENNEYLEKYHRIINQFHEYCSESCQKSDYCSTLIDYEHPIAYFCMEYAIDACLPIYAGGLGVLAGDYLKTLSDLNIPAIAVGLLYKQGYFTQTIDANGRQIELYDTLNPNQVPLKTLNDETGKPLLVNVELLGRTVYCLVWTVKIGRVTLYLLDTDTAENTESDRDITAKLYKSGQENRLMQEIILGIGGAKLLAEKLNITPSVYHLNEGHSAFLLLERIKTYCHQGFSCQEATDIVQSSSVFTTHTPVPAGNETFSLDLIRQYFSGYIEPLDISIETLLQIAQDETAGSKVFSMTTLALRLTTKSNAVSEIHGQIARDMWKKAWPSFLREEIPITEITNGIHAGTWLAPEIKNFFAHYLGSEWEKQLQNTEFWQKIYTVPNEALWNVHQSMKEKLLLAVRQKVRTEYIERSENHKLIDTTLDHLDSKTLLISFARRMATYKRADLILRDPELLSKLMTDAEKPITILIAGKAHPADGAGKALMQSIIKLTRDPAFKGQLIFLENYDMNLAKLLLQGSDVWLNTPLLGQEACGTSGMKAGMHGTLNFSTLDGWWGEMMGQDAGFNIHSFDKISDPQKRNNLENMDLMNTLEDTILPLYYSIDGQPFPNSWIEMMKKSIAAIAPRYNTARMTDDYYKKLYLPSAKTSADFFADNYKQLKIISAWKKDIADRFSTVKIKNILIDGLKEGKIISKGEIQIKLLLFSGKLSAQEIQPEFILIKSDGHKFIATPIVKSLELTDKRESGVLSYQTKFTIEDTGFYAYGIRILPIHPLLPQITDAGVAYWG